MTSKSSFSSADMREEGTGRRWRESERKEKALIKEKNEGKKLNAFSPTNSKKRRKKSSSQNFSKPSSRHENPPLARPPPPRSLRGLRPGPGDVGCGSLAAA
jgi:hypothetical protein